ncbi:thioredoxin family protein [Bacillus sp. 7586-K]|uniref:thioredoxin family protein n=1 Tax=Metabacillus niabensis TaxID=324854 RepID=UPI000BA6B7B0|nr:thioredoxin family protein [Bacillus sp. 7586-K]
MNLNDWYEKGITFEQYKNQMTVNKDEMLSIYNRFQVKEDELERLKNIQEKKLNVIVLTEDWCGDALVNNPILLKIAEVLKMDVRFLLRDQNLELMDQYLTNGTSRSIPIFIFIDQHGQEQAVWGPRAAKIQQLVDQEKSKLPNVDSLEFKEMQNEMIARLKKSYIEDESIWREIEKSIINSLLSI